VNTGCSEGTDEQWLRDLEDERMRSRREGIFSSDSLRIVHSDKQALKINCALTLLITRCGGFSAVSSLAFLVMYLEGDCSLYV
jgi:hypothetical protein